MLAASDARFDAALSAVESSTGLDALRKSLEALLRPYGLRHAVYHALHIPHAGIEHDVVVFTYPSDWVAHYISRKYFTYDPVVQIGGNRLLPTDWDDLDRSSEPVRLLFGEASDAGIGQRGLTIPIRGPNGDHAIFTVTCDLPLCDWRQLRRTYCRDMQIISHFVHSRVLALRSPYPLKCSPLFNKREREMMQWAAHGKTIDETAIITRLSPSTVRVYLDSARHKLNCLSKTQAVVKALRLGLISV